MNVVSDAEIGKRNEIRKPSCESTEVLIVDVSSTTRMSKFQALQRSNNITGSRAHKQAAGEENVSIEGSHNTGCYLRGQS